MKTVISRVELHDGTLMFRVTLVKRLGMYQARYWKALQRKGYKVASLSSSVFDAEHIQALDETIAW